MYWADRLVEKLDKQKKHRVDDMKTPSGHAHVGSLRAIGTHGLVYEAMRHAGLDVDFTYVVNDMDPMDGLPVYLDKDTYQEHMGKPLYAIPAPDGVSESLAAQYAHEYISAFNALGFRPTIFWSSQLYKDGKANDIIRKILDNVEVVRKIYKEVADQDKPEGWYPLQVICPDCGKIGSSLVTDWDGEKVTFECKKDLVEWAVGCGHTGMISPFDGNAKLMWKLDWPAHWKMLGVTVEGAGKDHMTSGGSHEIASRVMREVLNETPPFAFLHEFFLIDGAKMGSSKGNATNASDMVEILPPELARFLLVRTPFQRAINFNPSVSNTIPDLFDEYDRCAKEWYKVGDDSPMGRMYQASQIDEISKTESYLPRFRDLAQVIQFPSVDPVAYFSGRKGSALNEVEQAILSRRIDYARTWLEKYADTQDVYTVLPELPESASKLDDAQKKFLHNCADFLDSAHSTSGDELQSQLFEQTKVLEIPPQMAFQALYTVLLGKTHGPKAGWVLFDLLRKDKEFLLKRLRLS
ncbi:MAG: Lysine--tRNA ligase [Microgenomates bacterium OLB22]|nr:MAG: Lysine--tRNA ligase [Microgenomates bacterium OLB22]